MKQPRTFLLLGVVVATLLLGVAYAAINSVTLNINGTAQATPDQANFDVRFSGTPTYTGDGVATLAITGNTIATMNVSGLSAVGDSVSAVFTVKNFSSDLYANLTRSVTNTNTEYFSVTSSLRETTIGPSDTTTITVTVKLIKTPISTNPTSSIGVKITASPENSYY